MIVFYRNAKTLGMLPEWPTQHKTQRPRRTFPHRLVEASQRIGCWLELLPGRFLEQVVKKNRQYVHIKSEHIPVHVSTPRRSKNSLTFVPRRTPAIKAGIESQSKRSNSIASGGSTFATAGPLFKTSRTPSVFGDARVVTV